MQVFYFGRGWVWFTIWRKYTIDTKLSIIGMQIFFVFEITTIAKRLRLIAILKKLQET